METFKVQIPEVWYSTVIVEAESKQGAIEGIFSSDLDVEYVDNSEVYSHLVDDPDLVQVDRV